MAVPSILHTPRDITGLREDLQGPGIIPSYEHLPDSDESFSSDTFRINFMKILPCSKRYCHDWTSCPFCHHGEKARRRDPKIMPYTGIACPDMKKDGACVRGELCPYAHNVFEYWLHPTRYRTQLCNDGTHCKRRVCFFAHTASQLRVPESKPFVNPQALAAATAAAAARRSTRVTDVAYALGQDDLAERVALLQLQGASGAAGNQAQIAAMLHAQPQATVPPGNASNDQIIELLTALLRQKQLEQQNVYLPKEGQSSNDQLMALYQSTGLVPGQGPPQIGHAEDTLAQLMAADPTGQLALQLMANGGDKANGSFNTFVTPRSSLDMSGLKGTTPSDYTDSCRSSFETQQGRDAQRISFDGSRTDSGFGTSFHSYPSSNARLSLDGYALPSTSYDAGVGNVSFDNSQELTSTTTGGHSVGDSGAISESNGMASGGICPSSGGYVGYPLSGAAAAASAAAALSTPSMSSMGVVPAGSRRSSFDVAPGSLARHSGEHSYFRHGNGNNYLTNGVMRNSGVYPPSPNGLVDSGALRSVSLPDGLSKSRLAALNFDKRNSAQYMHLPAVCEGVPFPCQPMLNPAAAYGNPSQNGCTAPFTALNATVTEPAIRPFWAESPFSKAGQQMQKMVASDSVSNGVPANFHADFKTSDSFFANPPPLPVASSESPVSAFQLPEAEEVMRGIA